jgi:hypothetical protein
MLKEEKIQKDKLLESGVTIEVHTRDGQFCILTRLIR